MKHNFRRRKHRNGKRPKRKGSIKINLRKLPPALEKFDIIRLYIHKEGKLIKSLPDFPYIQSLSDLENPEFVRRFRRYEVLFKNCRERISALHQEQERLQKGHEFLRSFSQLKIADLALVAINDIQPEIKAVSKPGSFSIENQCANCKLRVCCPFAAYRTNINTLIYVCPTLNEAYALFIHNAVSGSSNADEKPMDYTRNDTRLIAEAWEIPLS